jgi:cytochrome b6-f complex iron-sulfur subunit
MVSLIRSVAGFLWGGIFARIFGLIGRIAGTAPVRTNRRNFVRNATLSSVGVMVALLAGGFVRFLWPNKTGAFGGEILVPAAEIPEANAMPVRNAQGRFWLVHNSDGLLALYTKCPHLRCSVPYVGGDEAYRCPCHGSIYDYNGEYLGGPAPRSMDYMPVTLDEGGNAVINTGDIRQRPRENGYDPSQAVPYPA